MDVKEKKQEEGKDKDGDGMKEILLSELVSGEVRAQRTLRVLQHQQERLVGLKDNLSTQSNLLKDLQDNHSELLEVYGYQEEVQDLQRELIKLQEIEYLMKYSNNAGKKESKLGERATKMWDLATKYFTPSQAHFILTAPVPDN